VRVDATLTRERCLAARRVRETVSLGDSEWQVEVDGATAADWSGMIVLFDDANIYQTSAYGGVRWGENNLSRLVLRRSGEVVAIAQLRIIQPTPLKFGLAYLRWGPLWERHGMRLDPEVPVRMVRAIEDEYVVRRRLFVRVIPNAFAGSLRARTMQPAFCRFTPERLVPENTYRTFVLDLTPSLEELRKDLDPKWRNKLSGAERNNLRIVAGSGLNEFRVFLRMYSEMRNRKMFETTVDVNEFGRIQEALIESQRMRILICEHQGIPVAGVVVSAMGDSAIYLLGATGDDGLKSKGAYLLQWTMIRWLKDNGVRWYDLGGIDPEGNPGVYLFKRGLSGLDATQVNPLVATRSAFSSTMVKAGTAVQRALRWAHCRLTRACFKY
jgi:hypothetical protein